MLKSTTRFHASSARMEESFDVGAAGGYGECGASRFATQFHGFIKNPGLQHLKRARYNTSVLRDKEESCGIIQIQTRKEIS